MFKSLSGNSGMMKDFAMLILQEVLVPFLLEKVFIKAACPVWRDLLEQSQVMSLSNHDIY